jgi:DNA invertase Pin-like site-specific DNA recombinase
MTVLGYIFLTMGRDSQVPVGDQQKAIEEYGKSCGLEVEDYFIEQGCSLKSPFRERKEAARLLKGVRQGDTIITLKSEWVLGSAKEGVRLIKMLKKQSVSLYCLDLKENITLETERKLVVSEGASSLILAVLTALAVCDSSKHGESIKATKRHQKREGKYLGGPVPFGWRVDGEYLVQDLRQQQIIREINKLRSDRWSYRDIVGKLKQKHNLRLSHEGIRRILANNAQKKEDEKKRELTGKRKKNPQLVSHKAPIKDPKQRSAARSRNQEGKR